MGLQEAGKAFVSSACKACYGNAKGHLVGMKNYGDI